MEKSINKIHLRGNVGNDPKVSIVGESKVVKFAIATNEVFKDRTGALKEETTWHSVVIWQGKDMPSIDFIKKGRLIDVFGKVRMNKYKNSAGEDKVFYDVLASNFQLVDFGKLEN